MSEENWVLVMGIPIIAFLLVRAAQRVRLIRKRIAEVQDELARNPQNSYAALAEMFEPPSSPHTQENSPRGKRPDR